MAVAEASRRAHAEEDLLPPHRCVVMVHGLGRGRRGSTLREVGEPLTDFVTQSLGVDSHVMVDADPAPNGRQGAWSLVRFARRADADIAPSEERLWLREAWRPGRPLVPNYGAVLAGLLPMWRAQVRSIGRGMRRSIGRSNEWQAPLPVDPAWALLESSPVSRVYECVLGLLLAVLFTLELPIVLLAILVAWLVLGAPGALGLPGSARAAARILDRCRVGQLGNLATYLTAPRARVSIRGAVERAIEPSLAPGHARTCRGLTIITHSWETVVTLDALSQLARRPDLEHPPLTLVTIGAALNRAWRLRPDDPLWRRLGEMRDWLPGTRWINVWSRFDPVPAGPLERGLWEHLREAGVTVSERRVVLSDDPAADHHAYWTNRTEVQTLLTHALLGDSGPPEPAIRQRLAARAERRRRVRDLVSFRLLVTGWAAALLAAIPLGEAATVDWTALLLVGALSLLLLTAAPASSRAMLSGLALVFMVMVGGIVVATNGEAGRPLAAPFSTLPLPIKVLIDLVLLLGLYKGLFCRVFGPRLSDPVAGEVRRTPRGVARPSPRLRPVHSQISARQPAARGLAGARARGALVGTWGPPSAVAARLATAVQAHP